MHSAFFPRLGLCINHGDGAVMHPKKGFWTLQPQMCDQHPLFFGRSAATQKGAACSNSRPQLGAKTFGGLEGGGGA